MLHDYSICQSMQANVITIKMPVGIFFYLKKRSDHLVYLLQSMENSGENLVFKSICVGE